MAFSFCEEKANSSMVRKVKKNGRSVALDFARMEII